MASIKAIGIGSGLDLSSLLVQLEDAEKSKLLPLAKQRQDNTNKISAYGSLKSALTKLQDMTKVLNTPKTFTGLTSAMSGKGVTSAADQTAVAGEYAIKVNALAKAHNVATAGVADKATALTGQGTLSIGLGTEAPVAISIAEGSTLEQIRDAINASAPGVSASIVNTGDQASPYKLVVASKTTGSESAIEMSFTGTGSLTTLLSDSANGGTITTVQAAQNASLSVNGIAVSSQTNTVSGALQGVTLSVSEVGEEQKLTVKKDDEAVKKAITDYVDAYNALNKATKSLTAFNEDPSLSGKLMGDITLRSIQSDIRNVMNTTEDGPFKAMVEFGVKLTPEGNLQIDNTKLDKAIEEQAGDIKLFFAGTSGETGFAGRMNKALEDVLKTEGRLDEANKTLTSMNKDLEKRYGQMEESIASLISRYEKQFASMDLMVSQMNSMMSYLTQQFDAMAAQTKQ